MKLNNLILAGAVGFASLLLPLSTLADYPGGEPITLVCSTGPGSSAAAWCQMMASEMSKPDNLDVPINVVYKPGGANNEAAVYTYQKPADGHTILHISGSWPGYFNLPHFTYGFEDFEFVARVEKHLYAIATRCDDPDFKSWSDVVEYAKAHPGELVMGSNKPGSIHHRNHVRINNAAGIHLRFVPYQGTGAVVKDVIGGHIRIGMAQPGKWNQHIEAGTACPLFLQNETRLDHPLWEDVPSAPEVGLDYDIAHQWQGFVVKAGTPDEIAVALGKAAEQVTESAAYRTYLEQQPHVIPEFSRDREALRADFEQNLKSAREFMLENNIISE